MPKTLYCLKDRGLWAQGVADAAREMGHNVIKVSDYDSVTPGSYAYVRLDQYHDWRGKTLEAAKHLLDRGCRMWPEKIAIDTYDSKIAQFGHLGAWMPSTRIIYSLDSAMEEAQHMGYPFISKSSEGASSANCRLIHNQTQAEKEAINAFYRGIPMSYGRVQKGYLYWQRLVPGNECDYRVIVLGEYRYGTIRRNRPNSPFASGSGNFSPLYFCTDQSQACLKLANTISEKLNTRCMAYDFVFDGDKPRVLEMSSSWSMSMYQECPMVFSDGDKSELYGRDQCRVIAREILSLGD